jgi:hypothetical protein
MPILLGALAGAALAVAIAIAIAKVTGKPIGWKPVAAAAVGGLVAGAVTAATLGLGAGPGVSAGTATATELASFTLGGAAGGASEQATSNELQHRPITEGVVGAAGTGAVSGLVTGGATKVVGVGLSRAIPAVRSALASGSDSATPGVLGVLEGEDARAGARIPSSLGEPPAPTDASAIDPAGPADAGRRAKVAEPEPEPAAPDPAEVAKAWRNFKTPLEDAEPLLKDSPALGKQIESLRADGWTFRYEKTSLPGTGSGGAYCNWASKEIVITADPAQMGRYGGANVGFEPYPQVIAKWIAHEVGHALDGPPKVNLTRGMTRAAYVKARTNGYLRSEGAAVLNECEVMHDLQKNGANSGMVAWFETSLGPFDEIASNPRLSRATKIDRIAKLYVKTFRPTGHDGTYTALYRRYAEEDWTAVAAAGKNASAGHATPPTATP